MTTCGECGAKLDRPSSFCPDCGARLGDKVPARARVATSSRPPRRRRDRKRAVVTALFCDVVGSTELANEAKDGGYSRLMEDFFDIASRVIKEHGGAAARPAGDQVMATFGVPVANEEDPVRAVRAAAELRTALEPYSQRLRERYGLALEVRMGINTGPATITNPRSRTRFVDGPSINEAGHLQKAAAPGEILLGEATYRLVRDAVTAEKVVARKRGGRSMSAYRLLLVARHRRGRERVLDGPMIGRDREQAILGLFFERVLAESSCHLLTLFGQAGVGKSRLVREFEHQVNERAMVVTGNCLSYGESVTFWPVMEIIRRLAGMGPTDPPGAVRKQLAGLLDEDPNHRVLARVAQLLGVKDGRRLPGDTAWALQRVLAAFARRRPLLLVVDNLQWAEPPLLDALEYVVERSRDVPLMLICVSRPELLDRRKWPEGKLNATSLVLPPLSQAEGAQLVTLLLDGKELEPVAKAHIAELAHGYPLFLQELIDTLKHERLLRLVGKRWVATANLATTPVPLTVHALLSGRLERLNPDELSILRRAAVVGERFHASAVIGLSPEGAEQEVLDLLDTLVTQDLIHPDHTAAVPLTVESGQGFRFRHIMVRDVAYENMPEDERAELHECYADWLESTAGDRLSQFDELVGAHLVRAYEYRSRPGLADERVEHLARRSGERFAAAGHRAALRGDIATTSSLLDRAAELLPTEHEARLDVLLDLAGALRERDLERATQVYEEAIRVANATGQPGPAMHATLGHLEVVGFRQPTALFDKGLGEGRRALELFQGLGDPLGEAKAQRMLAYVYTARGQLGDAEAAARRGIELTRLVEDEQWEGRIRRLHCVNLFWGKSHVDTVIGYCQECLEWAQAAENRSLEAGALTILARSKAMREEFAEARRLVLASNNITLGLGEVLTLAAESISEGFVEQLAGDLRAAERALRKGNETLERLGGTGPRADVAASLARVLLLQGLDDEAEQWTLECERIAGETQLDPQIRWRTTRAVVLARRGNLDEGEVLAREAIWRAERTDQIDSQAEAYLNLGEVLRLARRYREAHPAIEQARKLYEQKGNRAAARQATIRAAELDLALRR